MLDGCWVVGVVHLFELIEERGRRGSGVANAAEVDGVDDTLKALAFDGNTVAKVDRLGCVVALAVEFDGVFHGWLVSEWWRCDYPR